MTGHKTSHDRAAELRQQAEEQLRQGPAASPSSAGEAERLLHELQVHQIELEMQNEELRRAQAELEAARARYFDLFDLAPVGYLTLSEQGLILEANLTAATLLGVTKRDLVKRALTRFIAREDQDIYYRHREAVFAADAPQICELRMARKGADLFWARIEGRQMRDSDGALMCRAVLSDITEARRAEALAQEHYVVGLFMDSIPDAVYFKDSQSRFTRLSKLGAERAGFKDPAQAVGKTDFDLFAEEHARQAYADEQTIMRTGEPIVGKEEQETRPDGEVRWVSTTKMPLRGHGGRIVGTFGISRDITERKQMEEALQQERDLAQSLIETAPAIILVLDTQGRIVRFNRYLEELSGYRLHEVRGKDWFATFLPQRDRDHIRELFLKAITDIPTRGNVNAIVTQDGRELDIEWHDKTLKDAHGTIVGILSIGLDITERKQMEKEILRRSEDLAALNRIASALSRPPDLSTMLSRLSDALQNIVGCDGIGISLWDAEKRCHVLKSAHGVSAEALEAVLTTIRGKRMAAHSPVFLESMQDDSQLNPIVRQSGYQAAAILPLTSGRRRLGLLTLGSLTRATWQEDERNLVVTVSHQVAAALQEVLLGEELQHTELLRARLLEQVIRAQEDERTRVARELHDETGQLLAALIMRLGAIPHAFPESGIEAGAILAETEKLAVDALQGVRRMISDLRPPVLNDLGLAPALRRLGDELHDSAGVIVAVDAATARERLPAQMETALFRIVQEALSNVRDHAHARRATIRLAVDGKRVRLLVSDDGVGILGMTQFARKGDVVNFDRWNIEHGRFGLVGMRERAALMGGTFRMRSVPGQGTTIRVEMPLPAGGNAVNPTRVLICDDHEVVRAGIRMILERQQGYEIVGEAGDGREAIAQAGALQPEIVIMDLSMPGLGGLEAIPQVLQAAPGSQVLVLTVHEDEAFFFRALQAGAAGYVLKGAQGVELLAALRLVAGGGVPIPADLARRLLVDHMQRTRNEPLQDRDPLSAREQEVLPFIADGRTNKEIAGILFVSVRTVERFRSSVMNKLGLHSRAQLVSYAVRQGILGGDSGR